MTDEGLAIAAHEALRRGEEQQARWLFGSAARAEAAAFEAVARDRPRTRGILAISAASLWFKSDNLEAAEQFAHQALGDSDLPGFARQELRELLQSIWNQRAQREAGVSFASGQVMVSVKGGEVVTGGAPLDLILSKVQTIQNLFYRTVEYLIDEPLRLRGPASKEIQDNYRPWLFQSVPGSYQFIVAVQKPVQHDLFPGDHIEPETLTEKFLEIVRACGDESPMALEKVVTKPEYRKTFLKMSRSLAPSGKSYSQLEIKAAGDESSVIFLPESRKIISDVLREPAMLVENRKPEILLKGNLRALDLDNDWLDVSVEGETKKVSGLSEAVDDLIGPMVNHDVTVRVKRGRGRQLLFIDIEQDD